MKNLQSIIEKAWDDRALLAKNETREAIREVVRLLDKGEIRIAEKIEGRWVVNEWLKKAVIMFFPINDMEVSKSGIFEYYDKIPLKGGFEQAGVRVVHRKPVKCRKGCYRRSTRGSTGGFAFRNKGIFCYFDDQGVRFGLCLNYNLVVIT